MNRTIPLAASALALALGGAWLLGADNGPRAPETALPFAANAQDSGAAAETATEEETAAETESADTDAAAEDGSTGIAEMTLGAEDAPVEIIEYASFTCPHCASFHTGPYKQLKEDYIDTGKVKFIFREVYFDKFGLWASAIARCGGEEKFFGITDLMFKSQKDWARAGSELEIVEELRKIGRLSGMQSEKIESCLQDADKLRALVGWYQQNAEEHGIEATPSFVINGEMHRNMSYEAMAELIDAELGEE